MKHRKTIKRVFEYICPYGFKIIEMLILAVITVAFTLYTPRSGRSMERKTF